jgi:hypothetical protein
VLQVGCPRNKQKLISVRTETNQNKICFVFVGLFRETKNKNFGLFRCFEPISKQPKQIDLFCNKPKETETTLNFLKNTQIYSLLNCLGGSSVFFCSIETSTLSVLVSKQNNRNKMFRNKPKKKQKKMKKPKKKKKNRKNQKNPKFL